MKQLSDTFIENIYRSAKEQGRIGDSDTAVIFYSTEILNDRLGHLSEHFPENTLHAIAIKANSSPEILKHLAERGFGLEAASFEEVQLALEAGVPNNHIVFDSPVKTRREIQYCHEHLPDIVVNANSLRELDRYPPDFSGQLGLRINPLIGSDAPEIFNVSGKASKFGVPINHKEAIIEYCVRYRNVKGLHVHVGSGIRDYDANIKAVKIVTELAHDINLARSNKGITEKIDFIDIGGGIKFTSGTGDHSVEDFVRCLRRETSLFTEFRVITEYGKYVHTDAGFVVSDIEYIVEGTDENEPDTALIHVGADLFLRKVYSDLPIEYPYSVIRNITQKAGRKQTYNIAGPLCFSGDFLYYSIELDELSEDDKFVIQRTGANTLSMWSSHCSRKVPRLIVV